MKKELKKEDRLIVLIKDQLDNNEKKLIEFMDFEKSVDENIQLLIEGDILNFGDY